MDADKIFLIVPADQAEYDFPDTIGAFMTREDAEAFLGNHPSHAIQELTRTKSGIYERSEP